MTRNEKVGALVHHLEQVQGDFSEFDTNLAAIVERAISYIGIHETLNPTPKENLMSNVKLNRKQSKQLKNLSDKILPGEKEKRGLLRRPIGPMGRMLRAAHIVETPPSPKKTKLLGPAVTGLGLVIAGTVLKRSLLGAVATPVPPESPMG